MRYLALLLTLSACGSIASIPLTPDGSLDVTTSEVSQADAAGLDTGDFADTEVSQADTRLDEPSGPIPLPPCPTQDGALSYSSPCSPTCAVQCRDQLAHAQVGCVSREGITCVTDCQECP